MRLATVLAAALLSAAVFARPAAADIPLSFVHSGRLLDGNDAPVEGEVDIKLAFYKKDVDAAAENNLVWEHTYRAVHVSHGVYQIVVGGTDAPLKAADWDGTDPRYLGVSVGTGSEMKPRLQLAAVPWATRAQSAANADRLGNRLPESFANATHTHAAADVTDFAAAAVAAMGAKSNANPLNHDRYTDAEAVAAMGAKSNGNPLNHDRYTDAEAVAALSASGLDFSKIKGVPAFHVKGDFDAAGAGTVDWSRLRNVPAGFADGSDDGNTYTAGSGLALNAGAFSIAPNAVNSGMIANDAAAFPKVSGGLLGLSTDGKLGVGVTSPTAKLQVAGTTAAYVKETLTAAMLAQNGLTAYNDVAIVDGNTGTNGWHTDSASAGAWLRVDLGSAKEIVQVRVAPSSAPYNGVYDIQYSDDASSWTAASTGFNPVATGFNPRRWPSAGAHRYWRLLLTNAPGGGPWLNELELYRTGPGTALAVDESGNTSVSGNLSATGRYTGNDAQVGYVQPPNWGYSAAGTSSSGWLPLWSAPVTFAHETVLSLSLDGHWSVNTGWCYASVTVDGVPLADRTCNSYSNSSCWGAAHTYYTNWHPVVHTGYASVTGGTHQIGIAVVPLNGTTCSINGARVFYAAMPR